MDETTTTQTEAVAALTTTTNMQLLNLLIAKCERLRTEAFMAPGLVMQDRRIRCATLAALADMLCQYYQSVPGEEEAALMWALRAKRYHGMATTRRNSIADNIGGSMT